MSKSFHCPFLICTYWSQSTQGGDLFPSFDPPSSVPINFSARTQAEVLPAAPCDSPAHTARLRQQLLLSIREMEKVKLVKEMVVGRWGQSQDLCIWAHPLDASPPSMGCFSATVAELSPVACEILNTESGVRKLKLSSPRGAHKSSPGAEAPKLIIKETKIGAWGQDQKKAKGDGGRKPGR